MLDEKRQLTAHIATVRKQVMQQQKLAKVVRDQNKQISDDVSRLGELVC